MAVDLVLRLCQMYEGEEYHRNIALNDFTDGLFDLLGGYHTPTQLKTFYDMPQGEQDSFDILWGKITSATNLTRQLGRIHRFRAILTKWERRDDLNLTNYDTPDDIQTQLMALDDGFL